jgi:hypothetical protein
VNCSRYLTIALLASGGTTLAKIMHRKRPAFVPLYDSNIWRCYVEAPGAPVPQNSRRTWREFFQLLGEAMIEDLTREREWLDEIADLAAGPVPVTPLRALDIIGWRAGQAANTSTNDHDSADEEIQLYASAHPRVTGFADGEL